MTNSGFHGCYDERRLKLLYINIAILILQILIFVVFLVGRNTIEGVDKLWTLISVAFGGLVTYISTSAAERRKNKHLELIEKMTQILIPYCTCLEETIAAVKAVYISDDFYRNANSYDKWICELKEPLKNLNAAKRVFLSKKSRVVLQQYKDCLDNFEIVMKNESCNCLLKYKNYIKKSLINFPIYSRSISIEISMSDISILKLKIAIIRRNLLSDSLSLINDFTAVNFIHNDDPDNYRTTTVCLNEEARTTWGMINFGAINISDLDNPNVELACSLLDYIAETTSDEKNVLTNIIDETTGAILLGELVEMLESTRKQLSKEIDKIAQ